MPKVKRPTGPSQDDFYDHLAASKAIALETVWIVTGNPYYAIRAVTLWVDGRRLGPTPELALEHVSSALDRSLDGPMRFAKALGLTNAGLSDRIEIEARSFAIFVACLGTIESDAPPSKNLLFQAVADAEGSNVRSVQRFFRQWSDGIARAAAERRAWFERELEEGGGTTVEFNPQGMPLNRAFQEGHLDRAHLESIAAAFGPEREPDG